MAKPTLTAIGNAEIASSPNFTGKAHDSESTTPTSEELSDLDRAMDESGVVDKPAEQVEKEINDKALGKARTPTATPLTPPAKTEPPTPVKDAEKPRTLEPEKKVDPAAAAPKPGEKPVVAPVAGPKDDEIDSIQQPKGLNPANQDNWKKLSDTAKTYKTRFSDTNKKYEEAVGTINKLMQERGKLPDPIEKELGELRTFRKTFDYENDGEFKEKFIKPIEDTAESVFKLLGDNGLDAKIVAGMKAKGIENIPMASWNELVKSLTESESQEEREAGIMLRKLVNQHSEKVVDRKNEIAKMRTGQSDLIKKREADQVTELEGEKKFVLDALTQLETEYGETLKKVQAPADATPEQKAAVEEHNNFVDSMHKQFIVSYKPASRDQRFDTAMKASYALLADRQLVVAQQQNEQLVGQLKTATDELAQIKNATRMNNDVGAGANGDGERKSGKTKKAEDYIGMKPDEALEDAMQNSGL